MATALSMADFLNHDTKSGKGAKFMKSWKKRDDKAINTFIHCSAPIMAVYQHNWPRLKELKDKNDNTVITVWGDDFNSWEDGATLKAQYDFDKETGERVVPPTVCPMSIMLMHVRRLVDTGKISWTEKLFAFIADDPKESKILYAGGLYNAYGKKDITDGEKAELREAGIRRDHAWKQNAQAKCNYVFGVLDADNVKDGIQVTTETTLLGEKVQEVIRDCMKSLGAEDGNPLVAPYCIRWEHHPDEDEFHKKYKAMRMEKVELTKKIESIIKDPAQAPDLDRVTRPGNITKLRSSFETHYCGPEGLLDWDEIFAPSEALLAERGGEQSDAGEEAPLTAPRPAATPVEAPAADPPKQTRRRRAAPEPEPEPEGPAPYEGDDAIPCDDCKHPMGPDELVCPKCGAKYEDDDEQPTTTAAPATTGGKTSSKRPF